jgi:hypothetical protein
VPRKLTIAGTVAYALMAGVLGVQAVMVVRRNGQFADLSGWGVACLLTIVVLSAALVAAGAVTRRGLIAWNGPWIFRNGWMVLVGLTVTNLLVSLLPLSAGVAWVAGPAVFLPHFVQRLEDSYYDGVAEAEQQLTEAKLRGARAPRP